MENPAINEYKTVSIVLCTYNGEKYIREQMDSLLAQTYPRLEIIISDDASTDDTYQVLKQYAADDNRIRLYKNDVNLGYNSNFSRACSYANGYYIAIADQDDVWHLDKINNIISNWQSGTQLMYCDSVRFTGKNIPRTALPNKRYRRFEGYDSRKLAIFNTISGHALIVRKEFLEKMLPFPSDLMYDWWLGVRAACNGGVGYIAETLVYQRVHDLNVSVGKGFDYKEKKYKPLFNKMVKNHLDAFMHTPFMSQEQFLFYRKLSGLWSAACLKKFSFPLFFFLIRNRYIIFWYKKKKIGLVSHLKHCYLLAKN